MLPVAALALTLATLSGNPAHAGQIFIQQSGTSALGGGPNVITNPGSFVVGLSGSGELDNPLLVIVGVLNGVGTPTISFNGCSNQMACPMATGDWYGMTSNQGTFTSTSGGSAFAVLGLSGGSSSESWANWSSYDSNLGPVTEYSLYAFTLDTTLNGGVPISIDESGAANGSFITAYGCASGQSTTAACPKGDTWSTRFTNTGVLDATTPPPTPTPEPATLALFAAGMVTLGLALRRRAARRG
jgi:hypothetical protein